MGWVGGAKATTEPGVVNCITCCMIRRLGSWGGAVLRKLAASGVRRVCLSWSGKVLFSASPSSPSSSGHITIMPVVLSQ